MKSPLSQRQALFMRLIAMHVTWLFENGYEATAGSKYVAPLPDGSVPGHRKGSAHGDKMAEDVNVYLAGRYMDGLDIKGDGSGNGDWQIPHWQKIGAHWKSLDQLCRWGGDFPNKDYNHFSITPDGKRA